MSTDLATVITHHREITIATLADTITTAPNTRPELLQNLERIWQKDSGHADDSDRLWRDTARRLTPELRTALRHQALDNGQHYAARCLAWLTATAA